jgi:hypothetical protein
VHFVGNLFQKIPPDWAFIQSSIVADQIQELVLELENMIGEAVKIDIECPAVALRLLNASIPLIVAFNHRTDLPGEIIGAPRF